MQDPKQYDKAWNVWKYRLKVNIQDEHGNARATTYVECSHSPLYQLSRKFNRAMGKALVDAFGHRKDDCREGLNPGSMAAAGVRFYQGELQPYKHTTEDKKNLNKLIKAADRYFRKFKFPKWVNNLRRRMTDRGGNGLTVPIGDNMPWASLVVTTSNYGNETHLDMSDNCQGITIWHEKNPTAPGQESSIKNWFFLFPDMQICVDGEWHNGVAVPLQHGTIVTWDATLVRHCTAFPTVTDGNNCAYGTYFGVAEKVANHLGREEEKRLAATPKARRPPTSQTSPSEPPRKRMKLSVKQDIV